MSVSSMFEFKFPAEQAEAGYQVATAIGEDMTATAGYEGHDIVRDLTDPGHVLVITRWAARENGESVLGTYIDDPKIGQATELAGGAPTGFLGSLDVHQG